LRRDPDIQDKVNPVRDLNEKLENNRPFEGEREENTALIGRLSAAFADGRGKFPFYPDHLALNSVWLLCQIRDKERVAAWRGEDLGEDLGKWGKP